MIRMERDARLRLMKFVCSFAWTDLEITTAERDVIRRLVDTLELDQEERSAVARWLEVPPAPEEVDPLDVPAKHREVFVAAIRELLAADGVSPSERDTMSLFEELVGS